MNVTPIEAGHHLNGDFQTDFVSVDQLLPSDLAELHAEADAMRLVAQHVGVYPLLQGHVYNTLFWDSKSTRTKSSFMHAITRLGGEVIDFHQESSSSGKGETFLDTVEMLDAYLVARRDALIIRHNVIGSVTLAAELADVQVINAGDGTGEHPTQAILDTKTIASRVERIEDTHMAFFGDLAHARTVNSTAPLLAKMGVRRMTFVAPRDELRISPHVLAGMRELGVEAAETDDIREVAQVAQGIYAVRTQYEFMGSEEEQAEARARLTGGCLLTPALLEGSGAFIMHPLPQDQTDLNIHPDLRQDPRCIVKEQAANGEWTRMALVARMAGKSILDAVRHFELELPNLPVELVA